MDDHEQGDQIPAVEGFVERLLDGGLDRSIVEEFCERYPDLRETFERKYEVVTAVDGAFRDDGLEGAVIGDFLICEEIGRGGMGVVYLALQQSLDRYVALKVLPSALVGGESIKSIQAEARLIGRFNHPNIVPVFSTGSEKGIYYIAMALIPGLPLSRVIEALRSLPADRVGSSSVRDMLLSYRDPACVGPVRGTTGQQRSIMLSRDPSFWKQSYPNLVFSLCSEIADALAYAHRNGVCHGDVKPSNIMLTEGGVPMIVDFGLSRDVGTLASVRSTDFLGTLAYASPEQLSGNVRSEASDIWSLGVTIYEMLTLRHPYRANDVAGTLHRIARIDPPSLAAAGIGISRDAGAVVARCIEKEPRLRYKDAGNLKEDIENVLASRPVEARAVRAPGRLLRWSRRNRVITFLALFLLMSSATAGYALFGFTLRSMVVEGTRHMDDGEYTEALGSYERALRLLEWAPFSAKQRSEVTSAIGYSWSGKGEFEKAVRSFEAALRLDPNCASALMGLGDVYFEKGAYDRTIDLYNRVLTLSPRDRVSYFQRAKAYRERGMYDKALKDFRAALKLAPDDRETMRETLGVLQKIGLTTESSRGARLRAQGFDDREIESILRAGGGRTR